MELKQRFLLLGKMGNGGKSGKWVPKKRWTGHEWYLARMMGPSLTLTALRLLVLVVALWTLCKQACKESREEEQHLGIHPLLACS